MYPPEGLDRRTVLTTTGIVVASIAGCLGNGNDDDDSENGNDVQYIDEEPDYGDYLDDANLYDGQTVDMTGEDEIVVLNGADDGLAYEPAAVAVDPDTTVAWEWTGRGGAHNVVANEEAFNSGSAEQGDDITFEHTFDEPGVYLYHCTPHEGVGMKGAVYVVD